MKGSRLYMLLMGVFLVGVFVLEYMAPHQFVWNPTYDKHDKEPFGSFIFDDIMSSSVDGYAVDNRTFYQIFAGDSAALPRAFLLTDSRPDFSSTDVEYIYKLLNQGNQIMICVKDLSRVIEDTLNVSIDRNQNYSYIKDIIGYANKENLRDSIFIGRDTLNPEHIFKVYPQMHHDFITEGRKKWIGEHDNDYNILLDSVSADSTVIYKGYYKHLPINCDSTEVLAWDSKNNTLALRIFIGRGELFLVTTPLMFTNYGILDGDNALYVFWLLSHMKNRPLTRIEAYGDNSDEPKTPLRYVLSEPSLRWAIYFALMLIVLFMSSTARRRQRIIPVVTNPRNRTLEFMYLISNLYFQKHDNAEIIKMKYTYFCAEVKQLTGVDVDEATRSDAATKRLEEKTGIESAHINSILKEVQMIIYRSEANDGQLKQCIDNMNKILRELNIKT